MKPVTAISFLGSTLDAAKFDASRWNRWRPNVALCMHDDLRIDRLILLHAGMHDRLAKQVMADIASVSPETRIEPHILEFRDAWDFEEVYGTLLDFARGFAFDPEAEDYLVHITTGTHVAQICLFLLTEAHFLPGKLLQTQPPRGSPAGSPGRWAAIDLDLSRYDSIATRSSNPASPPATRRSTG
jgi:transcriptional regulatory protein RtcR